MLKRDIEAYHRLSDHYFCTSKFLSHYLAALIHPDTKGAGQRVHNFLADRCGWKRHLLPIDASLRHTVSEVILSLPVVKAVETDCRNRCDKSVVGINGQYSAFLGVLYQSKHGKKKVDCPDAPNIHVGLSVQCKDSILLVKPAKDETVVNQLAALLEAVGEGYKEVRMIFQTSPRKSMFPASGKLFQSSSASLVILCISH